MKKIFSMVVFVVFALTGCAALEKMEEKVCSEENEEIRMVLIKEIQKIKPWYPDEGLCGVEERIADSVAQFAREK